MSLSSLDCFVDIIELCQVIFILRYALHNLSVMTTITIKGHSVLYHEKKLCETTVVTAPGPMITAQSRLGEVTAQSRRGHSSVTARSQLSHGEVTAQSRHLQYDHGLVTARSQLNHSPGHGSVTAGCDHFGHGELTVSSHGGQFFSHGIFWLKYKVFLHSWNSFVYFHVVDQVVVVKAQVVDVLQTCLTVVCSVWN